MGPSRPRLGARPACPPSTDGGVRGPRRVTGPSGGARMADAAAGRDRRRATRHRSHVPSGKHAGKNQKCPQAGARFRTVHPLAQRHIQRTPAWRRPRTACAAVRRARPTSVPRVLAGPQPAPSGGGARPRRVGTCAAHAARKHLDVRLRPNKKSHDQPRRRVTTHQTKSSSAARDCSLPIDAAAPLRLPLDDECWRPSERRSDCRNGRHASTHADGAIRTASLWQSRRLRSQRPDDCQSSNAVAQRGVTDTIASVSDAGDAACWLGRYSSQTAMAGTSRRVITT
jgi:hypothetical protein